MGVLIVRGDFVGDVKVATNQLTESDVDSYIAQHEEYYLRELLGIELYKLFKADLNANKIPNTQIYKDIYDPIVSDDIGGIKYNSIGMKKMITNIVWFFITRDSKVKYTQGGRQINKIETSEEVSYDKADLNRRWNEAVIASRAIQAYIKEKIDIYPTFKGSCEKFQIMHWSI